MKTPSIALAFVASFTAALLISVGTMPPVALIENASASQDAGRAQHRQEGLHKPAADREQFIDCDVRPHDINGIMAAHRHVGDECAVRVINRSGERAASR